MYGKHFENQNIPAAVVRLDPFKTGIYIDGSADQADMAAWTNIQS